MAMAEFLTVGDVAKRLGLSADSVRLYERTKRLPALKTIRGLRLFRSADVERLRREREGKPAAGGKRP